MGTIYFEEQKITQKWIIFIQLGVLVILSFCSILLIFKEKVNIFLGLTPVLSILVFILIFRKVKLQTEIAEEYISYRFLPLQASFSKIRKGDIDHVQMRNYNAIGEYGGWGIRFGRSGKAYTIKDDYGIFITLHSKKNILIGTSKPLEATQALRENNYL
jgi:uncharacterized membrane protein YbhN (UPF0104 family)